MSRSTLTERTQRLNAAFDLITKGYSQSVAAEALVAQFGLSLRQAYRYLHEAQHLKQPAKVSTQTIPITIKMPIDVVAQLRAHAQQHGVTIGATVARAVSRLLAQARGRG
jgi:predicted DNA-binding transcriptional regulator YafY